MDYQVGKVYVTRGGRKIIFLGKHPRYLWFAIQMQRGEWGTNLWQPDGRFFATQNSLLDVVGKWVEPKPHHPAEDWVFDQEIMVLNYDSEWEKKYFSYYDKSCGLIYAFIDGLTSRSTKHAVPWSEARLPTKEELKGELK